MYGSRNESRDSRRNQPGSSSSYGSSKSQQKDKQPQAKKSSGPRLDEPVRIVVKPAATVPLVEKPAPIILQKRPNPPAELPLFANELFSSSEVAVTNGQHGVDSSRVILAGSTKIVPTVLPKPRVSPSSSATEATLEPRMINPSHNTTEVATGSHRTTGSSKSLNVPTTSHLQLSPVVQTSGLSSPAMHPSSLQSSPMQQPASTVVQPSIKVPKVLKLLNEQNTFQSLLQEDIKAFLDAQLALQTAHNLIGDVLVIGVLGSSNTGKSTLLNALSGFTPDTTAQNKPINTSSGNTSSSSGNASSKSNKQTKSKKSSITSQVTSLNPNRTATLDCPFSVSPPSKTVIQSHQHFSIEMTLARLDGLKLDESDSHKSINEYLQRSTHMLDNVLLIDVQSIPSAAMISQVKKMSSEASGSGSTTNIAGGTGETTGHTMHLLSLHIGLFLFSVCNTVLVVNDSPWDMAIWQHIKTLEMLKWTIPELTDLIASTSNQSLSSIVPQLKQSFLNARQPETYENMMLNISARNLSQKMNEQTGSNPSSSSNHSTGILSSTIKTSGRKRNKSRNASQQQQLNEQEVISSLSNDLTIDEAQVNQIAGALDEIKLYSPEQEYLPSLLFVFNKMSPTLTSGHFKEKMNASLNAFFYGSRFLSSSYDPTFDDPPAVLGTKSMPFCMIPDFGASGVIDLPAHEAIQEFVDRVLSFNRPHFKQPCSPRDWLIGASKMWELIKHSPILAQYDEVLKQTLYKSRGSGS